jgi:cytochrome c oxidase subunit 2
VPTDAPVSPAQGKPRPRSRRFLPAVLVGASALVLAGCKGSFGAYRGATTQGHLIFRLFQGTLIAAICVGIIVWGLIFWSIIRYRKRDDKVPRQFSNNIPVEVVYTAIPIVIVAILFGFTVVVENRVDHVSSHPAYHVKVTGFQWGWKFHYLGYHITKISNGLAYPTLVLPEGETTKISLVSNDVVHGFYVAAFDFDRYAQPGVVNRFDFTPRQLGEFQGRCSQFCGLHHDQMLFNVRVVTPSQFKQWLATNSSAGGRVAA